MFYYLPQSQSVGKSLSALLWWSNEGSGFKICWCIWKCERALGVPSNTRDVQLALGCFTCWRISLLFSICPERSTIGQDISGCFFPGRERNTSPGGRLCHQDPVCFGEVLPQGKKKIHVSHLSGCSFLVLTK